MKSILKFFPLFIGIIFMVSSSHASQLSSSVSNCGLQMQINMDSADSYTLEFEISSTGKFHASFASDKVSGISAVGAAAEALYAINEYHAKCSPSKAEIAKQVEAVGNMFRNQIACKEIVEFKSDSYYPDVVDVAKTLKRFASCKPDL